jgi:DNA-directed RNA polymerase subunit RPC12/RpoP
MSVNLKNNHLICPCGNDLGEIKDNKGYICKNCDSLWILKNNAEQMLKRIKKKESKTSVLDWLT